MDSRQYHCSSHTKQIQAATSWAICRCRSDCTFILAVGVAAYPKSGFDRTRKHSDHLVWHKVASLERTRRLWPIVTSPHQRSLLWISARSQANLNALSNVTTQPNAYCCFSNSGKLPHLVKVQTTCALIVTQSSCQGYPRDHSRSLTLPQSVTSHTYLGRTLC